MTTKNLPSPKVTKPKASNKRRHPNAVEAGRDHSWEKPENKRGQNDWLNDNGGTSPTCTDCGVQLIGGNIMADHAGFGDDGKRLMQGKTSANLYTYIDAKNNRFTSMTPLGCPTFMLDHKGTTMGNKERVRQVDDRVDHVEDKIDALQEDMDSIKTNLSAMVQWLQEMVALHQQEKRPTVQVTIEGGTPVALPAPVAQMIVELGQVQQREPVTREDTRPLTADTLEAEFELVPNKDDTEQDTHE